MENKKRFFILGLAVGVIVLVLAVKLKPSPELQASFDRARLVEINTLKAQQTAPQVTGFGRVTPKHSWQGIAEVSGKLIYRNPLLETGRLLPEGTVLLEIDPLEYQLNLAQAESNLHASKAQLLRIDQQEKNFTDSLKLEKQKLQLVEQEYQRQLTLKKKGLISSSSVENQKQTLLEQQNRVQDLQSSLQLLPDDRKVTIAQVRIDQSKLADSQRKLSKTKLVLPYDARIAEVNIEQDQVVSLGSVMLSAYQLGTVEIKAELSLSDMNILMSSIKHLPQNGALPSIETLHLVADVSLQMASNEYQWPAKVTRVAETVNPDQATIGVYLEVEQDFRNLNLPAKPPLTKGMFLAATINGAASTQFLIPEKALHENKIYLMDSDNKLLIKTVKVLYRTRKGAVITGDIQEGQKLVVNDLIPAVAGMSLKTVNNKEQAL
ncbi:efflux RND transporter periplasmic adaptor subunit [Psychromonas aquimarina]|uniref:efflux RND transporter periplasmic adaptor subunit n=1 Tax=Psychromonas aquimarina TaxID=444919 RepID=UPI0003FF727F|nr:acriflavin resistance protein [Psychromonas aquimarina]